MASWWAQAGRQVGLEKLAEAGCLPGWPLEEGIQALVSKPANQPGNQPASQPAQAQNLQNICEIDIPLLNFCVSCVNVGKMGYSHVFKMIWLKKLNKPKAELI